MLGDTLFADIGSKYGTPAYVYDLGELRSSAHQLRSQLPVGSEVLYSVKANPHPAVVETLTAEGMAPEVSSPGELDLVITPDRALYTGPGKTPCEMRQALRAGVRTFSVESLADRDRLAEVCERTGHQADYLVRINGPSGSRGGSLRMTGRSTAFGVDLDAADDLAALFRPAGPTRPIGTHTFSATNIEDPAALLAELRRSVATAAHAVGRCGFTPRVLDLGGGFPAPSAKPGVRVALPNLAEGLAETLDECFPGWRGGQPRILFESGRYLTATAGTLLTTVVDIKRSSGQTFVLLDAGVNVLGGMTGLGRLMSPSTQPRTVGAEPSDGMPVSLVGPLCTPLDVLNRAATLANPRPGQLLAVPNVGAYGLSASLVGFLSRPMPVEVTVDVGRVQSVRRLQLRSSEVNLVE
ncbi:type III PLP-dependent enzyme [Nocardia sp. NPDC052566]|uniref:type III PLP-dependent enzyme n=1 Tax=Nocardia sp. NPDC052566 TaxID=3364330 RepID=UPI0037CB50D4